MSISSGATHGNRFSQAGEPHRVAGGIRPQMAAIFGSLLLAMGGVTGWGIKSTGADRGAAEAVGARVVGQNPSSSHAAQAKHFETLLAQLEVDSQQAQTQQAADALVTAKSVYAVSTVEADAAVASATAKDAMAQKTLNRVRQLQVQTAATQEELDTAQMQADVASAELRAASSKRLALDTLKALVAQRESDLKAQRAKLKVKQAELELARSK